MTEKHKQALKLRAEDKTYEEIGLEMGCTKEYVRILLDEAVHSKFKTRIWYKHPVLFPNIDKWVKDHNLSMVMLAKDCGCSLSSIRNFLIYGHEPRKTVIDAILKVTGMSYEEAFKRSDNNKNDRV